MARIKAIAFDLFNTLITVDSGALKLADTRLLRSLREDGFRLEEGEFKEAYREEAGRFIEEARLSEVETHNRFWIHAALARQGYELDPFDHRIASAVEAYFSGFYETTRLIPGTLELLSDLRLTYPLGLLSNFTHGPAARKIIAETGLGPFFDVILISGELGHRKPSPLVFRELVQKLGVEGAHTVYVGDDPQPDIHGAWRAGLQPVWTTYVMDNGLAFAPGILAREAGVPDGEVPRISNWKELYKLLKLKT
ncbi:MAG: HAD family hydrolase [Desulfobacterales bacterium]|nr:HAD family hydrolase [Desulfobacterales bacterium]